MKANRKIGLLAAALGVAAFSASGKNNDQPVALEPSPGADPLAWHEVKDDTFDQRTEFFGGLKRLQQIVDDQAADLDAKRAKMSEDINRTNWDLAMKEFETARVYLRGMEDEIRRATPDTWTETKDRVRQAWLRTQDAYDKVKASSTS